MADVHTPEIRSYNMSRIKSKDTKPEILVRQFLFANGFRYRIHKKEISGKPDIVLKKYNTIIFIQGCFWHGHKNCKYFVLPKTRAEWWRNKINRNKQLDKINAKNLKTVGWNIIIVYECELKKAKKEKTLLNLKNKILTQT